MRAGVEPLPIPVAQKVVLAKIRVPRVSPLPSPHTSSSSPPAPRSDAQDENPESEANETASPDNQGENDSVEQKRRSQGTLQLADAANQVVSSLQKYFRGKPR